MPPQVPTDAPRHNGPTQQNASGQHVPLTQESQAASNATGPTIPASQPATTLRKKILIRRAVTKN